MILNNNDSRCKIDRPPWFKDSLGSGIQLHSHKGFLDLKIKCINDGELKINLRGVDVRDFQYMLISLIFWLIINPLLKIMN